MKSDIEAAKKFLNLAIKAIQSGDRQNARRFAGSAISIWPDLEEPWLILAAISSPRASVSYLNRALQINPGSEAARKGMHWAAAKMKNNSGVFSKPIHATPVDNRQNNPIKRNAGDVILPLHSEIQAQPIILQSGSTISGQKHPLIGLNWSPLALIATAILVFGAWLFWPGRSIPATTLFQLPKAPTQNYSAFLDINKPTYTTTFTPTQTPTNTSTFTPTTTDTPTPTATFTPTETLTPTLTPIPSNTPLPWPTNTPIPATGGKKWIDVDLSQQTLYVYEGDSIVASFLVSTGVSSFPTVIGQFHIYIKLLSTLMYGDGYYLPDVPYTMYFYKGYGIHGTYWHNNFGHPMSHGCVNMYTPDAEWLFYWAPEGTLVNIHY
jgi:lipoprotein-anchoring transpeptidase ErfK/SrfK